MKLRLNNRKITCLFIILIVVLCNCRMASRPTAAQRIISRWQITDWQLPGMPPEDTAMQGLKQEAGAGPDKFGYMEFMRDGKLKMSIMGQSETITYRLTGDTLIINNRAAEPSHPMLIEFSSPDDVTIKTLNNDKVYILHRVKNE